MTKSTKTSRSFLASQTAARDQSPAVEERIYQDIYDAIMEHRLPPRTKLTEQVLCQIYDTARHTVRKVLSRLYCRPRNTELRCEVARRGQLGRGTKPS